mmetsp:Transcript_4516/g.13674  ORF Transcript_4516/g.13674 Transcript_4516/m.13674 type:complete len:640 (+) Transcript_4516:1502-3421(+)
MPPLEAPSALRPPRVDVGRQDGRVAVLGALRQRRLLESLEHERLPVGALRKVARELLHLGVEAGLALGLELRAQRADASAAEAERLPRLDRLLLLEVDALLRRRHERLATAVAKQRQRGEVQGVLLALWVRARHAQIGMRHARLLVPVLLHRLQLDGVLQLPARLLLRAHYREPPRARVLSVLDPRADLELVELEGGGPAGRHAVLVHPGLRHLLLLVLRRLLRDLPPEPLDVRLLAAAAVIVVGARLFLSVARPRRGERGRNAFELEPDSREPRALGERRPLVALPRGPREAGLDVLAAALLHLGLALQPALRARHPRARALQPKADARARAEQARAPVQAGKPAEAATAAEAATHEDVARPLHPPGCARSDRHLDSAMAGWGGAACGKEAGRGAASALEAAGIAAQRCLIGIGRHCCESRLSGEEASGARVTKRLRVLMKWLLHHRLLPGGMQLALLGRLDHLVDGGDVPTHGLELLFGRRSGGPGVGEQVGRDLVLDEEVEQLLRERDLLGQRVVGQLEQRLELRLELDDEDAEDGPLELHRAVRLGEALLLRRQARDRVAELRRRRQRLEHQRDVDRVLVLQDEGVLLLEGACRSHAAEQQHEGGELPRACAQHEYRRTGTGARRGRRPPVRWRW